MEEVFNMSEMLAKLICPNLEHDKDYHLNKYAKRDGVVTRFAPSPTGFLHTGSLYMALINYKLAKDADGIFYLRIEDTDTKREVDGSIDTIVKMLGEFGVEFNNDEAYGPYKQSQRADIYNAFIYDLVAKGLAYPDFVSAEELEDIRKKQEASGERIGYYGKYAIGRNVSDSDACEKIKSGAPYVVRLKSNGDFNKTFKFYDELRGELEFPENDLDVVIRKNDGLPTYHFAHAIDDTLMGTSTVIRGEEWLMSVPTHKNLFDTLGFKMPKYMHISSILKASEDGSHRKLSKRKDPEASVSFLLEKGYPKKAFLNYLLILANSKYEDNMSDDYKLDPKNFSVNGSTFDIMKLESVCKEYIFSLSTEELYIEIYEYASKYDDKLKSLIDKDVAYFKQILALEHFPQDRKDYNKYSEVYDKVYYFYNELYDQMPYEDSLVDQATATKVLEYVKNSNPMQIEDEWVLSLKAEANNLNFAKNKKVMEKEGLKYMFADFMKLIRIALCNKNESFSLYEVIRIIGVEEFQRRIDKYLKSL